MSLYQPISIVSCLLDEEAEIQRRLLAPPVQPERGQAPDLRELISREPTPYLQKTGGGVPGIRQMAHNNRRGAERRTGE